MKRYSITLGVLWNAGIKPGLVLVTLLALAMLLQRTALAATIYVNSKADTNDGACDFNQCTLREAILLANSSPGQDSIKFAIPGSGVQTIQLVSPLPPMTGYTDIDGYSQAGASPNTLAVGNNAVLRIEVQAKPGISPVFSLDSGSVIRGLAIYGTDGTRIKLTGKYNAIVGSFIGSNTQGNIASGGIGIWVTGSKNDVGLPSPELRNVIVGNSTQALIQIDGTENRIWNNYIGINPAGTAALGQLYVGILIKGGSKNSVGHKEATARNIIAGHIVSGILISEGNRNLIRGNYVGTDASGAKAIPNQGAGIHINGSRNKVGGIENGEGNVIAFSGQSGVGIASGTRNAIRGNSIFSNNLYGIDLGIDGFTLNDRTDSDTGVNDLQNFPVLTLAKAVANGTKIKATLTTTPNFLAMLEFFSTKTCDPSGYGQGEKFIGRSAVGTDDAGKASVNQVFSPKVAVGHFITATATDALGNTSEFSKCLKVIAP